MKKLLLTLAAGLCAAEAHAVDTKLYGQVNRGIFGFDDGRATDVVFADNYLASTRFGFQGKQALDNGLTVGVTFETELTGNASNQFVQQPGGVSGTTPPAGSESLASRLEFVNVQGAYGNIALGKLSTAIDGTLSQDLVGAKDVMGAEYRKIGGGLKFQKSDGSGLSAFTIGSLTEAQSTNRSNAIRYDTPIVNGFQGKASVAQGGDMDMAVFYDRDIASFKVKAGAGVYFNNDNPVGSNQTDLRYLGSLSLAHQSGFAATVAGSASNVDNQTAGASEAESLYVKVGYTRGPYEVAVDAGKANHFQSATAGDNSINTLGLGGQYNLADGISLAALYRNFSADVSGAATRDVDLYGVNMRVKF